jgi:hypothetical protein
MFEGVAPDANVRTARRRSAPGISEMTVIASCRIHGHVVTKIMLNVLFGRSGMLTCGDELSFTAIAKIADRCATLAMCISQRWWGYRGGTGGVLLHRSLHPRNKTRFLIRDCTLADSLEYNTSMQAMSCAHNRRLRSIAKGGCVLCRAGKPRWCSNGLVARARYAGSCAEGSCHQHKLGKQGQDSISIELVS